MAWLHSGGSGGSTTAGEPTVITEAYTPGTLKIKRAETVGNKTFPAGAYNLRIIPQLAPDGFITINGEDIQFEGEWKKEARENKIDKVFDLLPEVIITNAEGKEYWYEVEYPSTNNVDISNL